MGDADATNHSLFPRYQEQGTTQVFKVRGSRSSSKSQTLWMPVGGLVLISVAHASGIESWTAVLTTLTVDSMAEGYWAEPLAEASRKM